MKKLELIGKAMLTKDQMKKISGGYVCGGYILCTNGHSVEGAFDCAKDGPDICSAYGYGDFARCFCS